MTIKVIKRIAPIIIPFEDVDGTVHELKFPGELSIVARLKIQELNELDESSNMTEDDLFDAFNVILGETNAHKLIHDLKASESELVSVMTSYIEEIGNRQTPKNASTQSQKKNTKKQ